MRQALQPLLKSVESRPGVTVNRLKPDLGAVTEMRPARRHYIKCRHGLARATIILKSRVRSGNRGCIIRARTEIRVVTLWR